MKKTLLLLLLLSSSMNTCYSMDAYIDFNFVQPVKKIYVRTVRTELDEKSPGLVSMKIKTISTECIHEVGYVKKEKFSTKRLTTRVFTDREDGEIAVFHIPRGAITGTK